MVKRKADWTPTMEQRAALPASSAVSVLHRVIYGLVPSGVRGSIPAACSVSRMSAFAIGPHWRITGPLRSDRPGPRRRLLGKRKRDPKLVGLLRYEPPAAPPNKHHSTQAMWRRQRDRESLHRYLAHLRRLAAHHR